ncbi:MAG TPA: hypothetical protein VK622_07685, partial [Puia sp.]|nr:hypothetical protein [Puia sp.]
MAVQTTYPGVYIQEVPSGVHTITGVSTSIGLFIGQANWGPLNKPVLCLSNSDFERNFTADTSQGNLPRAVKLFFLNGGTQCYVIRVCGTGNLAAANAATTITATAKSPGVLGNSFYFETKQSTIPGDNTFHLKFYRLADPANTDAKTELQEWDKVSMIAGTPRFIEKYAINNWVSFTMTSAAITTMPADGTYQLAGGLNGNNVTSGDYTAANLVAEKQIDLFNLMILPENVDLGAGPFVAREDLWGDASSFCEARRAFLIM